jgi:hypothetical protein
LSSFFFSSSVVPLEAGTPKNITNVFTDQECKTAKEGVLRHLANEYNVHQEEDFRKLHTMRGGMFHNYGVSLIKEILDLKTNEKTIEPFQRIWQDDKLTTSLDGLYLAPPAPAKESNDFFDPNKNWFHSDQSSHKNSKVCIQAFINLESTEHGDGCLSVLVNSHKFHQEFCQHFKINTNGRDWFRVNDTNHFEWYKEKRCEWKMIMAPKGSMVFWDSRTIHMGTLPRQDRVNVDRWRFVVYVCYTQAHLQSNEDTKLKRKAYIENRCTAHWPYGVHVFFELKEDTKRNDLKSLSQRHMAYIFGPGF